MQVSNVDPAMLQQFGADMLRNYRQQCASFEEAAQLVVEDFFNLFRSQYDEPEFALVRIFRTMSLDELAPDLPVDEEAAEHFLVLMGTMGLEEAWCDRRQSVSRQVIPINRQMSPMFKGVFTDLGFDMEGQAADELVAGQGMNEMEFIRYFYVEDVSSSSYITDQDQFVRPYGIQSAIAIGLRFISEAAYVLIGFSMEYIPPDQAERLVGIAPYISTLLAIINENRALWAE